MSNIAAQNLNFGHMQCLVRLHGGNNNRGHSSYGCTSQGKITPLDAQAAVFLFGNTQLPVIPPVGVTILDFVHPELMMTSQWCVLSHSTVKLPSN
jgi:hypothetical protein